jgi:DNA-directed RNA polymerase subunit RPC12/RpoP
MKYECLNCFNKTEQLGKHGECPCCGSQAISLIVNEREKGECLISESVNTDIVRQITSFRAFFA